MAKRETVGTGITKQTRTMYDVTGNTPGDIVGAKTAFRENFRAIGEKGLWAAHSDHIRQTCEEILRGKDIHGDFEADSPECFARRIRRSLQLADYNLGEGKYCLAEGSTSVAAAMALEVGTLWATAMMKWGWEVEALRGQDSLNDLRNGRAASIAAKKKPVSDRQRLISAMLRETNLAGKPLGEHLEKRLHNEHGIRVSLRTIRRDLKIIGSLRK